MIALLVGAVACAEEVQDTEFFEHKIRPIFVEHCIACHGEKKQKAGLRLDSKKGWEKGGETGPALIPKKSKDSLIMRMVLGTPGRPPQMPPDSVLPKELATDLAAWIDAGAPDPRTSEPQTAARIIDWKAAGEFWAFKPVTVAEAPAIDHVAAPIDRFISVKLKDAKLEPVPAAARRTFIRRATFDLTGLPPTPEQVQAFEADTSNNAYARLIDRLLASPQYGERQARAWLDVARYGEDQADKEGKEGAIAHAWRYRDWVIEAFNKDMPYDHFVKLQVAADLMENAGDDPADRRALGFIGLGAIYARPNDLDRKRAEEWDDRVDTLTRGFLGLTVSCARCHDHKYDPIPTQDYYSLAGVIASTKNVTLPIAPREQVAAYDLAKAKAAEADQKAKEFLQVEIDRLALEKTEVLPGYALAAWTYKLKKLEQSDLKMEDFARSSKLDPAAFKKIENYLIQGGGRSKKLEKWPSHFLVKGASSEPPAPVAELAEEFRNMVKENLAKPFKKRNMDIQNDLFGEKGAFPLTEKVVLAGASIEWKTQYAPFQEAVKSALAAVPPEPPQCSGVAEAEKIADLKVYMRGNPAKHGELAPRRFLRVLAGENAPKFTRGSGRLELAEALADPKNPLTARVMVNRMWQQHFGRGIVASPSNFGMAGERPTHPELLDYLAAQFVKNGWSVKKLHREIMLSEAYQRDSTSDAKQEAIDPDNRWLWRVTRRRLTVEEFRDAVLAVCGNLDLTAAGPGSDVDDLSNLRRTVYGKVSRHDLSKLLRLFDFPAPNISSDQRTDTTLPQQALFLINSPFMAAQAKVLAGRIASESDAPAMVRKAYALALMRAPTEAEITLAIKFLSAKDPPAEKGEDAKVKPPTRAERFALALLASNEFFYVD